MAHIGVMEADRTPLSLAGRRSRETVRRQAIHDLPPLQVEIGAHLHHVQQMLVAATLASGAIVAVAAVMMFRLF